jgi:hypothetical protein
LSDCQYLEAWSTDEWRVEATAWLDARLDEAGIRRRDDVEPPRIRPWGAVARVPTDAGTVWFKATAPATGFEAALYPILFEHAPETVLAPIAVDAERGWLVLPDGGVRLGDVVEGEALVEAMTVVLPRYAELQRAAAPSVEAMLAAGVLDLRPAALPERFDDALAVIGASVERHGSEEDRARHARIAHARPRVADWSERLAASPIAASIDHDDLHARNVLARSADALDTARIFDWGDSVVAHPFTSLLVALRSVQATLEVGPRDPALLRLRDAYLEAFTDLDDRAALIETVEAACHGGKIARALVWHRSIATTPPDERGDFADAPLYWLGEVLDPSWLGGLEF